jgi:hypothetical protein
MIIILTGIAIFYTLPDRTVVAKIKSDSSCKTCHETQGMNPVSTQGDWHVQHTALDICATCHGGNPQGIDQASSHAGIIQDPLTHPDKSCAVCHSEDTQDRKKIYADLLSTEEAQQTPEATLTPQTAILSNTQPVLTLPPTLSPAGGLTDRPSDSLSWMDILNFSRGPLFKVSAGFFALGMLFRLLQSLLPGWKGHGASVPQNKTKGIALSFTKGLIVFPFIPWIKGTFRQNQVTFLAGGLFHLGLFITVLLSKTHMLAWKSLLGFGWITLPKSVIDIFSAITIVAMLALFINRLVNPVLKLITGPSEWANWGITFLPILTGFILAQKLFLPYEVMFSLHMLIVNLLLIWIPLSKISHFMFYFFSRSIHGTTFESRPLR